MTSFSFKSSGTKFDSRKVQNNDITLKKKPVGIKTPLSFDSNLNTGLFEFNYDSLEQVKDNLRNLVNLLKSKILLKKYAIYFNYSYNCLGEYCNWNSWF